MKQGLGPCKQSHHVHSPKIGRYPPLPPPYHTTMAPCDGTRQWHYVHSPKAHHNGTLQWHPAMPLGPLPPKLVVTLSSPHHSTMAPCNGTQQWHYVHSPNHSTLEWHPAMAPSNGTHSPKVGRHPLLPPP